MDEELIKSLEKVDFKKEIIFVDGVTGEEKIKLSEMLVYFLEHEYYHQGIFTCYGRLAGLGKFLFM